MISASLNDILPLGEKCAFLADFLVHWAANLPATWCINNYDVGTLYAELLKVV